MTESRGAILSPDQLRIQQSARKFEAQTGHRASEYWDEFALWFAAQPKSEGGAMTAQQFLESRGLADLSIYWPTDKPIPQIDYESGQAKPTLAALMEALSAHNTAQLTKELADMTEDRLSWRDQALKAKAAQKELAEAALEINCAGPIAHRIRTLREDHEVELERLRSQGAGQWEAGRDAAAQYMERATCKEGFYATQIRTLQPPAGSPPEVKP